MLATALPDPDSLDIEAVKALLIAPSIQYARTLNSRATEIERLLLVEKLKHMLFGRKSEKVLQQIEQLELQIEDLEPLLQSKEEIQVVSQAERPAPAKPSAVPC